MINLTPILVKWTRAADLDRIETLQRVASLPGADGLRARCEIQDIRARMIQEDRERDECGDRDFDGGGQA